jgi:class 3 adenylate cyclase/TolB-like protein
VVRATTQHRLAAILSADVCGFSRLIEQDEQGALERLAGCRRVIDGHVLAHGGRIVGTAGDSVLAEFPSAIEAVQAAVEVQAALAEHNATLPTEQRAEVRIGVEVGDVAVAGDDIFGDGVNVAARLQALAEPGGVMVSAKVHDEVARRLAALRFTDLGPQKLKNISEPVRAWRIILGDAPSTPRQLPRAPTGHRLLITIAALGIAAAGTGGWLFLARPAQDELPPVGALASAIAAKPVLAVVPLANHSGDPAQDYLAHGIRRDLIAALSRFGELAVLSASAIPDDSVPALTPLVVAERFGSRYVVEGGVQRSGDRLRVTAQLVDAEAGQILWSDRFDQDVADILDVRDEIVRQVASRLALRIGRHEQRQAARMSRDEQAGAYDLTLQARELLDSGDRRTLYDARALLDRAIRIDPEACAPRALMADTYIREVQLGWTEFPEDSLGRAEHFARVANPWCPDDPAIEAALADVHAYRGENEQALARYDRAIALNPSDAATFADRTLVLLWAGEVHRAIESYEIAERLGLAMRPSHKMALGTALFAAGRHEEAVASLREAIRARPDFLLGRAALAASLAALGHVDEAREHLATLERLAPVLPIEEIGSVLAPAHRKKLLAGLREAGLE